MKTSNPVIVGSPRIYTDAPARCTRLPGGFLDFDTDCNVIVHRKDRDWTLGAAQTRLSIRTSFGGQRCFEVDGRHYVVDDSSYLLLNQGQHVSSSLMERAPVECLNVTFKPGFAEQTLSVLTSPVEKLLDNLPPCGQTIGLVVRTYPHGDGLSKRLQNVRDALDHAPVTQGWLEEQFHYLAAEVIYVHRQALREMQEMPGARLSTRLECYDRLHRARDYMRACLGQPLTLPEIAGVACLAPHHFLRLFKQAFHQTPHQYLIQLRLERAKTLLSRTDTPITEVCMEIGFESVGSFSWLFSRRFGVSPSVFRASHLWH